MTKEVDLRVVPIRDGDTVVNWELEVVGTNHKGTSGSYPKLHLDKDSSRHEITVTIADPLHQVKFPHLVEDAIWISEVPDVNAGSPTQKGVTSSQIKDLSRLNDTQIVFTDKNNGQERILSYQLNFDNGVIPLDPIIENGGGTGPGVYQNYILYAAGAALLIAVVFFFIGRAYQRSLK